MTDKERKLLGRKQAIEPIVEHVKSDRRMNRCYFKGEEGDAIHAEFSEAGYNILWLL